MSNNRYNLGAPNSGPVDRATTRLLYVSTSKYGGDWNSMMHSHTCAEIFYVVGGAGQFKIEGLTIPVRADDMVVVNPMVEHTEVSLNASPLEYIVLGVEGLEFSAGEEMDSRYCTVNFRGSREDVLHTLRNLLREIEERPAGYDLVCQNLLEVLLVRLMRLTDFSPEPLSSPQWRGSKECAAVHRYIDGHFKESITLGQLARLTHLNKYYMAHRFSREYGISPINYLISRRIIESKVLLADTDHSLSQISHMLGFSSPSYFSQSFRRLEEVSPIEYRRQHRTDF